MTIARLEQQFRRIAQLQHASSILQWDEAVMMPPASGEGRASALTTLGVVVHEQLSAPTMQEWLADAEAERAAGKLDPKQSANVREMGRIIRRADALPSRLVEACSTAQLRCEQAWRKQRANNDWQGFSALLRDVVAHKREAAAALGEALACSPYDALLDEYEPFYSSAKIDAVFEELRGFLPDLIQAVLQKQRRRTCVVPRGTFPATAQAELGRRLMQAIGFDLERGRLDVTHHPFCGGVGSDVRIAARYDERDFSSGMLGVLHETGHGKYEQGRPRDWLEQPIGEARGMSIHEGQSLLQEMQISRSREFLRFAAPFLQEAFPEAVQAQPDAFTPENLRCLFTRVAPGKIRVNADEVTYPCHILVRYGIERDLIAGELEVAEIPQAWDAAMRELLDISTGDDYRDGCMQDVHWPSGAFGYFPTYALGAMTAAQVFMTAERELPGLREQLSRGEYTALNDFLRERIWSQGSLYTTDELLTRATGEPLNPQHYQAHLRQRYLDDAR
jgi:carboxypeptidase Taq